MNNRIITIVDKLLQQLLIWQSYIIMFFALLVCCFFHLYVDAFFLKIAQLVSDCSKIVFAICICSIVLVSSLIIIRDIGVGKKIISHNNIALILFCVLIYLYYRCISAIFVFWGGTQFVWMDLLLIPCGLLFYEKITHKHNQKTKTLQSVSWPLSDNAIKYKEDDSFGYVKMVETLVENLNTFDLSETSYSVGIEGRWGYGKTSFLNLFCSEVEKDTIIVRFNPRSAKSIDTIQEDFFRVLSDSLADYHSGVKCYVHEYANAIQAIDDNWIGKIAKIIPKLERENHKKRVNDAIDKIGKRIYVIVEDLDRLTGSEIVEVLKLIDVNGDFHNTIFLTAYDKVYVNTVLNHYIGYEASLDYTDKYFEYEFHLPVHSKADLIDFFSNYLKKNIQFDETDLYSQQEIIDMWDECSLFVVDQLKTIRHIKRFINLFMSRYPSIKNDVNFKDFIYITLLRYTDPIVYSAILDGRIVESGSFLNGDSRVFYQLENISDILNELNSKVASWEILNNLYPNRKENEGMLEDIYNRVRWKDSANRYFFDNQTSNISYKEVCELLTVPKDTEAFDLVNQYIGLGYLHSISDFLVSRAKYRIYRVGTLSRLIKLIVYLDKIDRDYNDNYLDKQLLVNEYEKYKNVGICDDQEKYKSEIMSAMKYMLDYAPLEVGFCCIRLLNGVHDRRINSNKIIVNIEELIRLAEWAQKYYAKDWGTDKCVLGSLLNISKIRINDNVGVDSISLGARLELEGLMKLYPNEFARQLVLGRLLSDNRISIEFNQNFDKSLMFPIGDFTFDKWLDVYISDEKVKYILSSLNMNRSCLVVEMDKELYGEGGVEGVYNCLIKSEQENVDGKMMDYLSKHIGFDVARIRHVLNVNSKVVRDGLRRLVDAGKITPSFLSIKEEMESFRIGDFVMLSQMKFNSIEDKLLYSNNIFIIEAISDTNSNACGEYKLDGIEETVSEQLVEPIPIDGIHDKNIYYSPVIAASIISNGQEIPSHGTDYSYYMHKFEKEFDESGMAYNVLVKEFNCQFVHEVQHLLVDKYGSHNLKINKSIRV